MLKQISPQAVRYFHTLRYLQPRQTLGRLLALGKKRFGLTHIPQAPSSLKRTGEPSIPFLHHDPWNQGERLLQGEFCFLRQKRSLGRPVDWQNTTLPLLWQFNLHYFQFLHLLDRADQIAFCKEWIHANPLGKTVGWHPFPTALRLVNWCKAGLEDATILNSLYQQAAYLFRNIETYHPGNHLLENARALVLAGCYFQGQGEADLWRARGLEIYWQETPQQILNDGGHFERSPMYHALMLEGYLDILNVLPEMQKNNLILSSAICRMSDFLISVIHPDGNLALFNDTAQEIATPPQALLQYTERLLGYSAKKKSHFAESGYFIHESPAIYLILDGGVIAPDFLPAHAHADIFSYELSLHGLPFIVDSGVFEYPPGGMRDYVRSTQAHNTVCVDQTSQAECWKSFRVARRYPPLNVSFVKESTQSRFQGSFDGYAKLIGDSILHRRVLTCSDSAKEILIEDTIEGSGSHLVESRIHLHPAMKVTVAENTIHLQRNRIQATLHIQHGELSLEEGWYCPQFGLKQKNEVLVISQHSLPTQLVYSIKY